MVAVAKLLYSLTFLVVVEAAGVHQPLVHQVWGLLEATVVLASPSPSQAPPPHTLGEVEVQELTLQAQVVQGEGGLEVPLNSLDLSLPLVYPTLVVGAGGIMPLEQQAAQAS
jgi:hypothetical protein